MISIFLQKKRKNNTKYSNSFNLKNELSSFDYINKKDSINNKNFTNKIKGNNLNKNKNEKKVVNIINYVNNIKIYNNYKQTSNNNNNYKISIKTLNDEEINSLEYEKAIFLDKRSYFQYYFSLLKKKQLLLFTFYPNNDYNLIFIKIALLFLSFSLYFTVNAFFFTDETMHKITVDHGVFNIIYQIPQIAYSTVISVIINMILKKLSLSELQILSIKKEKNFELGLKKSKQIIKCIKIKFVIFFILSFLFSFFFWYFISGFCAVFKNTQIILIKNTFLSFGLSMLYPFGLNLLPGMFQMPALSAPKKNKKCLYKFSNLVAII